NIPLFVCLPDAMVGPTPVSALIHAATMVTAGVYMVVRCSAIFTHAWTAMFIMAIIGAATALFAATIGIAQNDIKKVLAYSTISQLGYMFLACGVGAFVAAVFHVVMHAFFKAQLFLGSGSVIIGTHHEQDMRRMGGLRKYMPITWLTMCAGWLAICGVPIFAGFFSKDQILWKTWVAGQFNLPAGFGKAIWLVGVPYAISSLTGGHPENYFERTLSPIISAVPANETAERGAQSEPIWLSPKPEPIDGRPAVAPVGEAPNSATGAETPSPREISQERIFALISIAIALSGIAIGWFMFQTQPLRRMPSLLEHKYYVDEIDDAVIINPIHVTSREGLWKIFDLGVIDGLIHSLGRTVVNFGKTFRYLQMGFARAYAAIILAGAIIISGYFAYNGAHVLRFLIR